MAAAKKKAKATTTSRPSSRRGKERRTPIRSIANRSRPRPRLRTRWRVQTVPRWLTPGTTRPRPTRPVCSLKNWCTSRGRRVVSPSRSSLGSRSSSAGCSAGSARTGRGLYRFLYLEVPRGNGKSASPRPRIYMLFATRSTGPRFTPVPSIAKWPRWSTSRRKRWWRGAPCSPSGRKSARRPSGSWSRRRPRSTGRCRATNRSGTASTSISSATTSCTWPRRVTCTTRWSRRWASGSSRSARWPPRPAATARRFVGNCIATRST